MLCVMLQRNLPLSNNRRLVAVKRVVIHRFLPKSFCIRPEHESQQVQEIYELVIYLSDHKQAQVPDQGRRKV